ncbi:MAG: peptidylprolyl isomerase [Gammaproteobacteria bacterium]
MNIEADRVARIHYTLRTDEAGELESSRGGEPMAYLHGHGNIIPGLEAALEGRAEGESFSVSVPPEEGYGHRIEGSVQRIPVKHLQGARRWRPGMIAHVQTDQGMKQVQVVKVGKFMADVDTNHPLAGKTLIFDIEVVSVREATAEEVAHGHAHGAGGHHH